METDRRGEGGHRVYRELRYAFGRQVLTLRTRVALTQSALAAAIGVHRRSVQNWETGESYPKAETLQRLLAVLLQHHAFTKGHERAEAHALWSQARQDGPHPLASFDDAWFGRTLASSIESTLSAPPSAGDYGAPASSPAPVPARPQAIVDWGEAIAVPTLYGREHELARLHEWIVDDHCRVVTILGLGGLGKSSLAIAFARRVVSQFDIVLFRSLQNAPPLADVLDQVIHAVSGQPVALPPGLPDKIARLVQLFRERRCLLVLDNLETILQSGALTGAYHTGYAECGLLLQRLSEGQHQSCLLLTSREKPAELGPLEGRAAPVCTLELSSLDDSACRIILEAKDVVGTAADVRALARLYGGNPLALTLVAEPIRELFGGDVGAFLAAGDVFFNGVGKLLGQQLARSTPLEQNIMYWLAIERELTPLSTLLARLDDAAPHGEILVALESLRRRSQIERGPDRPAFTLQPVILEFVTEQMVEAIQQEIVDGQPKLLHSHAVIQATAKDYIRRSQEQLIATVVLERLAGDLGDPAAVEGALLGVLAAWRTDPPPPQSYGPGNIINLLRVLRGHLRALDLVRLPLRQAYLQGVEMQDTRLTGAVLRDGAFTETFGAVAAVAMSSSGEHWAAGSRRGGVRIWAVRGMILHRAWRAHGDRVHAITFSPDGRTLATSGSWDGTLKLWDVASGALLWVGAHPSYTSSVAFAPDGHLLASSGNDAAVRLWDPRTGRQLQTLPHPDPVSALAWSPDGHVLASGDSEGALRLWEVTKTEPADCLATFVGHTKQVEGLAFAPDGSTLASGSWDGMVKLWDVATGHPRQMIAADTKRAISSVIWSPDGQTLASAGSDQQIWLWDVEQGAYRGALQAQTDQVSGLAFAPDSRELLSGSEDGTLRLWDIVSRQCTRVLHGYSASHCDIDWSPDGTQLVVGGSDALVMIFDVTGGTAPRLLRGHIGAVMGVGWSSDSRYVASSEWNNAIRLWDPSSGACRQVLQHPDDPGAFFDGLAWSPDGRRLAGGTYIHGLLVWDRTDGHTWSAEQKVPTWIRHVAWSPDGRQIAGGSGDGCVYVWDAAQGMLLHRLAGHHSSITSVTWRPDGAQLASGSSSPAGGELFVWDMPRGVCMHTIVGDPGMIYAVAWGSGANLVISAGSDGVLRWWDVQRHACVHERTAHQGTVQALRRSPDGSQLVSCGDDGALMLWDLDTATYLRTLRRDRPYERMQITGLTGITDTQRMSLRTLGALDEVVDGPSPTRDSAPSVVIAASAADAPPLTRRGPTIEPPFQPAPCIGRDTELSAIARLLSDPGCRLLTLLGPGGIGKTRLALEIAARQTDVFADGVAFIPLVSIDTPDQILSIIGDTLSLAVPARTDLHTHLLSYLSERQMLLVFDNFEHLLEGADLVSEILTHAPRVTALVTSHERLNLQAEWLFDVDGLAYPPEDPHESTTPQSLDDLAGYGAVQLFVQRARQVQPAFPLSEATLTAIMHICQHVAGIPLAIELAAANVRLLPVAEIERQIRANLDGLATTLRDVPERHRSMHAVFDHSWNLLSEPERVLFSRLAVFRGGCTAAAAEHVAGPTLAGLTTLIDKSLVRQESTAPATANAMAEPRFVLREPIRAYALEQLAARDGAEELLRAHATYYLALAEAAADWDNPSADAKIAGLDREYDNLRAALQWARDGGDRTIGLRLGAALRKFWRRRGASTEGRVWLEELLALDEPTPHATSLAARQRAAQAAAWLASDQHDFARAAQLFEQSASLRRAIGETEDDMALLLNAAPQARAAGQYQRATALLEDAVARHRALDDRGSLNDAGQGLSLFLLAMVRREQGDFVGATALFEACVELHRAIGDREGIAVGLLGLSDVARDQGDVARLRAYGKESLASLRTLGVQWAIGFALNNLALAAYLEGDLTQAAALASESVSMFRAQGAVGSLAEALITLGKIVHAQGDAAAAQAVLDEALQHALTSGPRVLAAAALEGMATLAAQAGEALPAVRLLGAAAELRARMGTPVRPMDQPAVKHALAAARLALGVDRFAATWDEAQTLPIEEIVGALPSVAWFSAGAAPSIESLA